MKVKSLIKFLLVSVISAVILSGCDFVFKDEVYQFEETKIIKDNETDNFKLMIKVQNLNSKSIKNMEILFRCFDEETGNEILFEGYKDCIKCNVDCDIKPFQIAVLLIDINKIIKNKSNFQNIVFSDLYVSRITYEDEEIWEDLFGIFQNKGKINYEN